MHKYTAAQWLALKWFWVTVENEVDYLIDWGA
jgi:hypothetical protein